MNRERERTKDTVEELMHENEELRKLNKELTEKWVSIFLFLCFIVFYSFLVEITKTVRSVEISFNYSVW